MKELIFSGAGVAIITPMNEDGSVNFDVLGELLEFQINNKTDAIVVTGTTGESATLEDPEHLKVVEYAVNYVNKRIPVIAGVGSNNTAHAVMMSKEAKKLGADALLHVTPYYNKTSQRGLVKHYETCAKATDLPIILYNVPSRTGVNILPDTYATLSKIDTIVAAKEASGNLRQVEEVISLCGDRLTIYSGNDDQITDVLELGGKGVISVLSNVLPKETHDICQSFLDGDKMKSRELQEKYKELIQALFMDVNPIPVKQALNFMGYQVGSCRLPLCDLEEIQKDKLLTVMKKYEIIKEKELVKIY
ncbi:4-hydroxy-tetrahydrodipicolinate synthase [Anaeromicropila herbilytica]|uniref:4-hydroxy-tetrahydrodipicolinate synthase n=1 Tax=Anaeromicropila herbilytica TaxID=2785025 RepID=A0A7R7ID72_9FIRM|nr:4-hydroxy-tetrahydrodipicolinate synthase [Anaeromicropila herbilytica]BCN31267.1 4-hydroxy-tetrahydrodipicolinate synthase [Anaeromicropila herbilytica]